MRVPHPAPVCFHALLACVALVTTATGQTVWSGLTYEFMKPDDGEPTDPLNQDRISANVILTRDSTQGIFNIAKENSYDRTEFLSPLDTLWATDLIESNDGKSIVASNWEALEFKPWREAYGGSVLFNLVDLPAVLYLVTDNVYLDIQFTSWTSSFGGGFSYLRGEGEIPPPIPTGDYNGNEVVDAADYTILRDTFGQTVANLGDGADGDRSGMIDLPDYDHWKVRFGNMVPLGARNITAVPEPSSMLLLLGGLMMLGSARRLRRGVGRNFLQKCEVISMNRLRLTSILTVMTLVMIAGPTSRAAFHRWQVKEVFTTADGSVQFIELYNDFSDERFVSGHTVRAVSDGVTQNLNLTTNLSASFSTAGKHFLVATSGFGSLPGGRTPDYFIPSSFLNPNAASITISFVGVDSITFAGSLLPKNGVDSLTDLGAVGLPPGTPNLVVGTNSPTPFGAANDPGSVNLAPPSTTGDYNGNHTVDAADYTVWRDTLGAAVSPNGSGADGDGDGTIDDGDYDFWKDNFGDVVPGAGGGSAAVTVVPEPATLWLIGFALFASGLRSRRP